MIEVRNVVFCFKNITNYENEIAPSGARTQDRGVDLMLLCCLPTLMYN